jgi:hypothetical protein
VQAAGVPVVKVKYVRLSMSSRQSDGSWVVPFVGRRDTKELSPFRT